MGFHLSHLLFWLGVLAASTLIYVRIDIIARCSRGTMG